MSITDEKNKKAFERLGIDIEVPTNSDDNGSDDGNQKSKIPLPTIVQSEKSDDELEF